jgi:hypothetical protein
MPPDARPDRPGAHHGFLPARGRRGGDPRRADRGRGIGRRGARGDGRRRRGGRARRRARHAGVHRRPPPLLHGRLGPGHSGPARRAHDRAAPGQGRGDGEARRRLGAPPGLRPEQDRGASRAHRAGARRGLPRPAAPADRLQLPRRGPELARARGDGVGRQLARPAPRQADPLPRAPHGRGVRGRDVPGRGALARLAARERRGRLDRRVRGARQGPPGGRDRARGRRRRPTLARAPLRARRGLRRPARGRPPHAGLRREHDRAAHRRGPHRQRA